MAADIDSPSRQSRARERRVPSFRCKGDLHLSEQKRGRLFCEVILHILWLMSGKIGIVFRSDGVVLANLRFEDCSIESWSSGSIVEVENCTSSRITDTIQLHHVSFENNILIGSSGLAMRSPSCFELELIDFVFENNTCNGRCGVILSRQNRLRDVVVYRNKPFDSAKNRTTVFHAPPGSVTSVERMKSSENRCSSIHVQEGSLDLSNSVFNRNLIAVNQSGVGSTFPTTAEESSTLVWERLLFELNEAQFGGAIIASRSNVTFSSNTFEANDVENGGVIYIKNSTLSVQKCDFTDGSAVYGGGIYATFSCISVEESSASNLFTTWQGGFIFAQACVIRMSGCSFSDNRAAVGGGVLACNRNCSFSDKRSEYSRNSADFGGAIHLESNSSGIITNSQFVNNNASTSGGACHVEDSALIVQGCRFANGFAEYGGGINSFSSNISVTGSSASDLSADQYGGFLSGETSEIHMSGCSFSKNTAGVRGGVLACRRNCSFTDTKSNYSDNLAGHGGSINMKENTSGIITNCQFDKNEALTSGGTCYVQDSMLTVQGCRFAKGSAKYGGAIRAIRSDISVKDSSASDLSASQFGGFLSGEAAEIHMSDCSFSNNTAAERGGVIECAPNSNFTDMRSNYSSNSADYGGGISVKDNSSGIITDCQFDKNEALLYGGAAYVEDSILSVQECHFTNGSAEYGGGINSFSSVVSIWETDAFGHFASEQGGFISAQTRSTVNVTRSSIISGKSRQGGAIFLSESVFRVINTQISLCEAESDGGAIMGNHSSRLLCSGCTLINNNASRGGAIFFEYSSIESIFVQLDDTSVLNNSAEYGGIHEKADRKRVSHCSCVGGIQISAEVESILQNCRTEHGECGVAAVANTSLINNRATSAGGAVFIDTVAGLRLRCSDDINQRRLELYSEKQWKTMKRLTSIDDICTSWKNNTAERYGPDVASSVSNVQKEITIDKTGVPSLVNGKNHTILNHRSGEQIPAITLTLVDELGQGPAVGESNEEIKAVMFSPDGFFIGNVTKTLGIEGANLSAVGFVQPGIYRVLIDFEGASLETFEITVEVKPCDIGEVLSRDGKFCESCNVASYNFSPEDDSECHPCPENGDCSSRVILPNRGYWHPTPCSEHIQRCLTTEGCDSDNREDVLLEITQDVLMCQFDEQYLLNYTEAQCREASTMFVC